MGLLPATVTMKFNAVATSFPGALLAVCLQPSPDPSAAGGLVHAQITDTGEGTGKAKLGDKMKRNEAQDLTLLHRHRQVSIRMAG